MVRCADCGANFTCLDLCRSHIASVHFGWLDYHCLYCLRKGVESRFGGQHEVQEHIHAAHQQQEYAAVCMQGSDKITRIDAKIRTGKNLTPEPEIVFLKEEANDEFETVPKIARAAVSDQQTPEAQIANNKLTDIKPELILIEDDDDFEPFPKVPMAVTESECKTTRSVSQMSSETNMEETSESSTPFTSAPALNPVPQDLADDMQRYMAARPLDMIRVEMQRFLRRKDRPWNYSVDQTNVKLQNPPPQVSLARHGVRQSRAMQAARRLLYETIHTLRCDRLAEKTGAIQCTKMMHAIRRLKQGGNMYVVREAVSAIDPMLADLIVQTAIFWQVPNDNNYTNVAMVWFYLANCWGCERGVRPATTGVRLDVAEHPPITTPVRCPAKDRDLVRLLKSHAVDLELRYYVFVLI